MKAKRGRRKARKSTARDEEEQPNETLYCFCRSSACDGFMIGCDGCEEWYHGECVNITAKQAEFIQKYYCQACIDENPDLHIVYKPDHPNGRLSHGNRQRQSELPSTTINNIDEPTERFGNVSSRKRSRKHSQTTPSRARRVTGGLSSHLGESSEDEFDLDNSQFASPSSGYSQSHSGPYSSKSKYSRATPSSFDVVESDIANLQQNQQIRRSFPRGRLPNPCGECENCKTRDNCGTCEVCRSPKFKQGRSRQQCLTKAKMCLANEPDYQQLSSWRRPIPRARNGPPCGECESCRTKEDCGYCVVCKNPKYKQGRNRQYCLYKVRMCHANNPQRQSKSAADQSHMQDNDYDAQFDDFGTSSRVPTVARKSGATMGSKMRRGDHLPGGSMSGQSGRFMHESMLPSRRGGGGHSDLGFLDNAGFADAYDMPASHRNGSSRFMGRQGNMEPRLMRGGGMLDTEDLLGPPDSAPNYESDEDVVLPEMRPCAGPACSKPAIRSRYCSEECQLRHESMSRMHPGSRYPSSKEPTVVTPYGLPYMDHIYCKYHRNPAQQGGGGTYNVEASLGGIQQGNVSGGGNSSVSDLYSDVYGNFVGGNQSAVLEYVFDSMPMSASQSSNAFTRRLPVASHEDYLSPHSTVGHMTKMGSRKFAGLDEIRGGRMMSLSERRQQIGSGGTDILSHPVPLDSITPTMQPLRMYNGSGAGGPDFRVPSADGESAAAAELLAVDANDLMEVDGASSSGVGAGSASGGGLNAASTSTTNAPAFRQGDEYYMMNENENLEINWPTSPGGVATASAGTV